MRPLPECRIPFRSASGAVVGHLTLVPVKEAVSAGTAPLVEEDEAEAREHGETTIQLRESEQYEYEVTPANGLDLRLRSSLSTRRKSLKPGEPDAGRVETGSWCGTLLLELVAGETDDAKPAVASALLDVRSLKVDYRTEYRGMLRRLADELAGLVSDVRASAKAGFRSSLEVGADEGWLQIHLELLRETLDGADFAAALQRILSFPHERLSTVFDSVPTDRPIRWTASAVRQLIAGNPRRGVPARHHIRTSPGLETVADRVLVRRRSRDVDTPENRFVKFALQDFRAFLTHAQGVFESCVGWGAPAALAGRLAATVEDWLARGLFREVGEMQFAPLGSPVLQGKAGYRELLSWWLRFRAAAELSWEGGDALFRAGQRDMATLYEYWLFFELLGSFSRKFNGGNRPPVEQLVEGLHGGSPSLRLKKRTELGPFAGTVASRSRRLNARFAYNRRFDVTAERDEGGSWTRRMHPDYTLTFWPDGFTEREAEQRELLVHVHFDAKYRVADIESLFGATGTDDADDEVDGNYKRQDLLKMHAYRDAIKRSQGAYVLYPGRNAAGTTFKQYFHEILPGLGAFGVAPDQNGAAQGLKPLEDFLDELLTHLSNRTTAQERVSYHVSQAYTLKEHAVPYGALKLTEFDIYGLDYPALPPAEHMVLVAWYRDIKQLEWTLRKGLAVVRLGKRPGAWHVQPEFSEARHLLLHSRGGASSQGLWRLRSPGYKAFTAAELKSTGYPGLATGEIYAVFEVEPDMEWVAVEWHPKKLIRAIRDFENRIRYRLVRNIGRRSAYPRIVPLRDLLNARLPF